MISNHEMLLAQDCNLYFSPLKTEEDGTFLKHLAQWNGVIREKREIEKFTISHLTILNQTTHEAHQTVEHERKAHRKNH